mgnify:CR=1 FL=1
MCEEITKNSDICKRAAIISGRLDVLGLALIGMEDALTDGLDCGRSAEADALRTKIGEIVSAMDRTILTIGPAQDAVMDLIRGAGQ